MDVAAAYMGMVQSDTLMQASLSVAKMAMDTAEQQAETMVQKMLPPSPYTFDVYA